MDNEMRTLDDFAKRALKGEYTSLTVMFNDHSCNYIKADDEQFGLEDLRGYADFPSPEELQKARAENSVWTIQWYPNTPVGFICVGASTFERALEYAYEVAEIG